MSQADGALGGPDFDGQEIEGVEPGADHEQPPAKIGQNTLTSRLGPPVQLLTDWGRSPASFPRILQMIGGDGPPDGDAHTIAATGVEHAGAPLPHLDAVQASFGRHDVGGVRAEVGGPAADASASLGARAYAVGDRVGFASSPDLHTTAHEAAHVVQQRSGVALAGGVGQVGDVYERHADAVADAVVAGQSAEPILDQMAGAGATAAPSTPALQRKTDPEHYHPTANDSGGGMLANTAQQWMWNWQAQVQQRVGQWLTGASFASPSPFVVWKSGSSADFATKMWHPIAALGGKGQVYAKLTELLQPDALDSVINTGRDASPVDKESPMDGTPVQSKGDFNWCEGVVDELGKYLDKRIIESLKRIMPRWLISKNQLALAAEGGDKAHDRDPTRDEVAPSHPIDPFVIDGLATNVTVDLAAYRAANPDQNVKTDLAKLGKQKTVEFEWQHDKGAWNWVRVKTPGATAEDVAFTLYGSATFAHTLTDAAPMFAFTNTDDLVADLHDSHGQTYSGGAENAKKQPQPGDDDSLPVPEQQAQSSAVGDDVALAASRDVKPTVPANESGRLAVLERMRGSINAFDMILADSEKLPAGGYPSMLQASKTRLQARIDKIKDPATTVADAVLWDGQSSSQLDLLGKAKSGVVMANAQYKAFESWPNSRNVVEFLGHAYLQVACMSDMASSARDKLAYADEQSKLFPVTLAELLLAEVRKALHTQGGSKYKTVTTDARHDEATDKVEHDKREAKLREGLARIREKMLQNPESAKAELQGLIKELSDLQTEVSMVADMDQMETAWQALYDDLSVVGVITGANSDDSDAMSAVVKLKSQWSAVYSQYKSGDKEGAKKALEAHRPEWKDLLEKIKKLIKHNETKNKWVTFGILVGIAIITAGVGAYVEGVAGAAWGATSWATFAVTTGSEALAFTSMSYLITEKDPTIAGFFLELGKNAILFGALKGLGNQVTKMLGEEANTLAGKAQTVLTQFVALNTLACVEADAKKYIKTGQHLTPDEVLEISKENVLFMVAAGMATRLAKPGLESLKLTGEVDGSLVKLKGLKAEMKDLTAQIEATKGKGDFADKSKDLTAKERELIRAEEETLQKLEKLANNPKEAKKAGLDTPAMREKLAALRAEHNATADAMKPAAVMESIEGSGSVRWAEKGPKWKDAVDSFRANPKNKVIDLVTDKDTGAKGVEVTTEDGQTFRLLERMSHEDVSAPPEQGQKAPTAEEVAENQKQAEAARAAMKAQTEAIAKLIDGKDVPEFERLQVGGDVAGLFNQASMGKAGGGGAKPGSVEWPKFLTVSDKPETWADRGPVNQTPGELQGPGLDPSRMTADQHGYIGAKPLADAIMLGKYESGMARYQGRAEGTIEVKGSHTSAEWPSSKNLRIKINGKYFYADAIDLATGPGPSNTKPVTDVVGAGGEANANYQKMVKDGRIFYGDSAPTKVVKPGGKVLVWGGSGNGAAMAEYFAKEGCDVSWLGRISQKEGPPPPQVRGELEAIDAKLKQGGLGADEMKQLLDRKRELQAFGQAMLPRNVEEAFDSPLAKEKIHRSIDTVTNIEPIEVETAGVKEQKVKVTRGNGTVEIVDQVVVSLGQNADAPGGGGSMLGNIELEMIISSNGDLVGLQSVEPKGAVRLLGAAYADRKLAAHVRADQRTQFLEKLAEEAARLPPNSKGVAPSIANAANTIQAANDVLAAEAYKLPGAASTITLRPGDEANWPVQLKTFFGGELGVDPARIGVEQLGGGKSGTPVFRIRVGEQELGVFKVFNNVGEAQTEVSMIKLLADKHLKNMSVVGEKGTLGVADGAGNTKGGMMMETAQGQSVDGMIDTMPTEPLLRQSQLAKLREAVIKVAKGLGELHSSFQGKDPLSNSQKSAETDYMLKGLDGIKAKVGDAHYAKLREALQAKIDKYMAAKVPATANLGDANTGNFIIGPDGKVKVIDVGTMKWSVDGKGQGQGTGAADVARFLESLQSKRPGALTPEEVAQLTTAFNQAYFAEMHGKVSPADLDAATTIYRAQLEMSIIRASSPDAKDVTDRTYTGALGRLDTLLGIPPDAYPVPLTPPAKTSTDDDDKKKNPLDGN
jgi:hypothetical protein